MSQVQTVRGPVDVANLGPTLMHEHIFIMDPQALVNYGTVHGAGPYWDEEERVADAIVKLRRLREGGITTIVDPTVPQLGRDIGRVQRVNAEVDLHIVVASGIYAFLEMPGFLATRTDEAITELFVREITEGINDTGVCAAFLKCAVESHGLIGDVPRILRTVAAAAVQTGVPVMVHTNAAHRTGLLALQSLVESGVEASKIVIAHAGDSNDLDYLRTLADGGAWLGFDRFGIEHFNPTEDRIRTLAALVAEGYADQIHLSHDGACFYDFMVGNPFFAGEVSDYLFISREVIPQLLDAGVSQEAIDQMMIANPRRFFDSST